jgi:hypothetical protein
MNKSKSDLAHLVLMIADISYDREQEIERLRKELNRIIWWTENWPETYGASKAREIAKESLKGKSNE